ncbi:hypothetical protein [Marinobacter salsuginis]|uniref:hypothetical protein n=1 Tax=Marinobacter salsuginis TaxID=418719 RepID=UPI002B492C37|nr:hypothetical protein [Marinobacter salsuginis]
MCLAHLSAPELTFNNTDLAKPAAAAPATHRDTLLANQLHGLEDTLVLVTPEPVAGRAVDHMEYRHASSASDLLEQR